MRRRLLAVAVPLILVLGLAVALGVAGTVADDHTSRLATDRSNDASRFTVAALTALGQDDPGPLQRVEAEMDAYAALHDSPVWLIDREADVIHATSGGPPPEVVADDVASVLAGQSSVLPERIWPWGPRTVHLVVPVGIDSQVSAALVLQAPTERTRHDIAREWGLLSLVVLVPLLLLVAALWPLSRWLLRPVEDLERSAEAVARGELDARAATVDGPPELRGLGRTFNQMVESVGTTVERQQQFLDDAAHQLRNPITSTRLAVENLEHHLDDDEAARETWAEALDDVERMGAVVEGLLDATRLQTQPAKVSTLTEAIGTGPERWRRACADAGMSFAWKVDDAPRVVEPTGGLSATLDELVSNAVRLSGGTRLSVHGAELRGTGYRIVVADDGRGLDPSERELALRRFWRSPHSQNVPGTGLGLTILAQVVADAGGTLDLAEADGGGLAVELLLAVPAD